MRTEPGRVRNLLVVNFGGLGDVLARKFDWAINMRTPASTQGAWLVRGFLWLTGAGRSAGWNSEGRARGRYTPKARAEGR